MAPPTSESVQLAVLQYLDQSADGTLADSRELVVDGTPMKGPAEQIIVKAAVDSLARREMISYVQKETLVNMLTPEGISTAKDGSFEVRFWAALPLVGEGEGKTLKEIQEAIGESVAKLGQPTAMKKKWVTRDGVKFFKAIPAVTDDSQKDTMEVESTGAHAGGDKVLADLKKRKLLTQKKFIFFSAAKGPEFALSIKKQETDLTTEMIQRFGAWKNASFKKYNFEAAGVSPEGGALHPLLKVREEFRNIFFEMGFTEMPTNKFVESAFWNFDAMFVPQQHPAREMQDTFYIKEPSTSGSPPADYYERVSTVHEKGGYGSIGYRAPFSQPESEKLLLRTHTTAVSTQMLYNLANQPGGFKPTKMFSIDRVFRNETTDATHLAEFHQVEGVVADYGITLADLIGFMTEFFKKMGIENLRFKPAYNPYTEPSLEIFQYHEQLDKTIEIGNSGMFRPEMLEPMGIPKGVRVLGWGLSLERPTMVKYKIKDIRTLVGHKVDVDGVRKAAAVRLDKGVV
ncbi:phenylalanine-trna ligase [Phaffia rhodozyma]|uniref:phenylalanine--tRNA ligase n=1 Tax=Phaffia rhodozyma TaxID=264483 RepID=A0A0F7SWM0_PHARH|nr:phenylalanine-trna ligase [Phaffia rhodozyma]